MHDDLAVEQHAPKGLACSHGVFLEPGLDIGDVGHHLVHRGEPGRDSRRRSEHGKIEVVDPETGLSRMDTLEDERQFDTAEIEAKVTAPESNRKILEEIEKHADKHEKLHGRFPKEVPLHTSDRCPVGNALSARRGDTALLSVSRFP